MKKIISLIFILTIGIVLFSCSEDDPEINDNNNKFTAKTYQLKANLEISKQSDANDENVLTKGDDDMPTNAYPLDVIYLMYPNGNRWQSFPIYQAQNANYITEFDLSVTPSDEGNTVDIKNANGDPINVPCGVNLYLSSVPTESVTLTENSNKKTPDNINTYDPYGKDLYKSEFFKITVNNGDVQMMNKTLDPDGTTPLQLVMYRLTGLYTAHIVFYRKKVFDDDLIPSGQSDPPYGITNEEWTGAEGFGYSPIENWSVIPYLTEFPLTFLLNENDMTGIPYYNGERGIIMLANGPLSFVTRNVGVKVSEESAFTINTYAASTDNNPYVYNTTLSRTNCQMKYVIKEGNDIVGIISVNLAGTVTPNDLKSLWIAVNAKSLDGRNSVKSIPIEDIYENEIPASFYWWE